jgi:2-iminoacetate synthase
VNATAVSLSTRPTHARAGTAAADVMATDLASLRRRADDATEADVLRALHTPHPSLADIAALLSPAAATRIEDLAQVAHRTTVRRFGRVVRMFAPLYLSNECISVCTYCGFRADNDIPRRTLSVDEARSEARALVERGFRHVLLVSGEHPRLVSKDYLVEVVRALAPEVPQLSVETQVWDTGTYRRLVDAGCDGLVAYQESYDLDTYGRVHVKGKKRNYHWRLAAPDRGAEAGMRRLGIAALLGLHDDWRSEALALAAHARALIQRWWRAEVTVSLPRLRPAAGGFQPADVVSDADLTQLLAALRIGLPDLGIVLSTREPAALRDALLPIGVTQMSAGSHTEPGGYAEESPAEAQFEVGDLRSPAEVADALRAAGYDPVWKDWQRS